MKKRISGLIAAILLLSTSFAWADGRPTGIRIGEVRSNGANVEIDVTVTGTNQFYFGGFSTTVWIGNDFYTFFGNSAQQFTAPFTGAGTNVPLPYAIQWGDGYNQQDTVLSGPPGGPFTGTFAHSYATPGTYLITVGDAYGPDYASPPAAVKGGVPFTGNAISTSTRYGWVFQNSTTWTDYTGFGKSPILIAITNQALVGASAIPALDLFGLAALALVLLGTGLLLFRRREVAAG